MGRGGQLAWPKIVTSKGPVENRASQVASPLAADNITPRDGALDWSVPTFWGDAQRRGFGSCRAAGRLGRWGGGGRDSQPHGQLGWANYLRVDRPVMQENGVHPRASTAAKDRGRNEVGGLSDDGEKRRPDAKSRSGIFVNTGRNTIVIDLEAEHSSVDHVRAQVHEREGITPEHQRLIYTGKRLTRGELRLEDYGVTERATLGCPKLIAAVLIFGALPGLLFFSILIQAP